MSIFRRAPLDPELERARAEAAREQARADLERVRAEAQLQREQQEAQAEFDRRQAIADEDEKRRRDAARRAEKAERRERNRKARAEFGAKLRPVLPLLLINGGAAYAQAAYAYSEIAPAAWNMPSKLAFALAFAGALESVAVYVQWHAHDALMLKAHATAASLRRSAWGIAAVVAVINYAHFANGIRPTAAAVAFALLSLLSPWLWGLHTRRAQHVQLLAEDANLIDEGGVEFSPQRRRAFPWRSWQAKRWSIDHNVRDPHAAWEGYNAERLERKAERRRQDAAEKADKPASKPEPVGGDDLDVALEIAAPAPAESAAPAPAPVVHRPRWRPPTARRPRRMATPRAPEVTVVVAETATPAATRPARRWHLPTTVRSRHLRDTMSRRMSPGRGDSGGDTTRRQVSPPKPPAADTNRDTVTRRVSRPKAPAARQSTADRVAAAVAKNPAVKPDALAKKFGVSTRTIQRAWPKQPAAVNGHDHSKEQ